MYPDGMGFLDADTSVCEKVIEKMTSRMSLDAAEKAHLAECDNCMGEIIRRLDEAGIAKHLSGEHSSEFSTGRPNIKKALEKARQTFEREFGIKLGI